MEHNKSVANSQIHRAVIDRQNKVTNYLFESLLLNKICSYTQFLK